MIPPELEQNWLSILKKYQIDPNTGYDLSQSSLQEDARRLAGGSIEDLASQYLPIQNDPRQAPNMGMGIKDVLSYNKNLDTQLRNQYKGEFGANDTQANTHFQNMYMQDGSYNDLFKKVAADYMGMDNYRKQEAINPDLQTLTEGSRGAPYTNQNPTYPTHIQPNPKATTPDTKDNKPKNKTHEIKISVSHPDGQMPMGLEGLLGGMVPGLLGKGKPNFGMMYN